MTAPLLEMPGQRVKSQGLLLGPTALKGKKTALLLPIRMAPAALSRPATALSFLGRRSKKGG